MRKHKYLSIAIICLALLLGSMSPTGTLLPVQAAEPAVFSCTSAAGQSGDSVEIQVSLSAVAAMSGGAFNLKYDPQLLKPLQIRPGSFLQGYYFVANPDYNNGQAVRAVWAKAGGSSGNGVLCTITFKLLRGGQAALEFTGAELKNTQKQDLPYTFSGGTITISGDADNTSSGDNPKNPPDTAASGSSTTTGSPDKPPVYKGYQQSVTGKVHTTDPQPSSVTMDSPKQDEAGNSGSVKTPADLSDIKNHWAKDYIEKLVAQGVLQGYTDGTFKPDQSISRAEFTVMLTRALDLPAAQDAAAGFKDWDETPVWARAGISAAVQAGLIKGYSDGTFRPDRLINRAEMAVMIVNALQQKPALQSAPEFADAAAIPDWAKEAVARGVKAGLINGKGDNLFQPAAQATRAESACMTARLLEMK